MTSLRTLSSPFQCSPSIDCSRHFEVLRLIVATLVFLPAATVVAQTPSAPATRTIELTEKQQKAWKEAGCETSDAGATAMAVLEFDSTGEAEKAIAAGDYRLMDVQVSAEESMSKEVLDRPFLGVACSAVVPVKGFPIAIVRLPFRTDSPDYESAFNPDKCSWFRLANGEGRVAQYNQVVISSDGYPHKGICKSLSRPGDSTVRVR